MQNISLFLKNNDVFLRKENVLLHLIILKIE